jgi:hypothetical protein
LVEGGNTAFQGVQRRQDMETVKSGQCGLCSHFGEHHKTDVLVSIRTNHKADLKVLDECGHPKHAGLHLKVTAISGCDGFVPAAAA